jgi:hypothetical protein
VEGSFPTTTHGKKIHVKACCLNSIKYMVKKYFVAPDYTYLHCGMQYVHWLGYNVMLCHQLFKHQGKTIHGNMS